MSSEYFRIYCQKKRSDRKLAGWRVGVAKYERKRLACELQLAAAAATDAEADALIAAGKRARLIQYSLLRPDDDAWKKVPRYIKLSLLPACAAEDCTQNQGEYAWMAHCVFRKRGGPYLCNKCVCVPERCNAAAVTGEQRAAWFARKLAKPYATGLVFDETTSCVNEPDVNS